MTAEERDHLQWVLRRYIHLAFGRDKRTLTHTEKENVMKMLGVFKKSGILITELLMLKRMMHRIDPNLSPVERNIEIVVNSLSKQRELMWTTIRAYEQCKPEPETLKAINQLLIDVTKRQTYIRDTVLMANVGLTPVKEYIDIVGEKDFISDLRKHFPELKDVFDESRFERYICLVVYTVDKHGKLDDYKPRLAAYLESEKRIAEAKQKEQEERKRKEEEAEHAVSEELMNYFRNRLIHCINRGMNDDRIGFAYRTFEGAVRTYGRERYIVLVAYFGHGSARYRYLSHDFALRPSFGGSCFCSKEDAEQMVQMYAEKNPKKAVEAVYLNSEL